MGEGLGWVEGLIRLLLGLRSFLVCGVRKVGLGMGTLECVATLESVVVVEFGGVRR